ncbi:hypothetical protein SYNPS1DRAFT_16708 [Syncephalis pseudoplumigaleata]|uniref:Fe2OG dioxygenase domain-containing protein n=1 Tax=Syncephalis pseudoplumigaleata TaxID=1712513 RepID=A0A4P9YTN6_9FUNG|nr:hypothetical protein SYNPS1DRAFT_19080 [Syncephalis pseudoplumigaleata]RKP24748.1 hypothetical protein SYNPS1DRAFT_16708 [Syncephalis pseudoplumigaleata]|eukprot:RKP23145.1 hypothetical protein SYNPS1DRAFT_19080 [Syncephalis pseudoplumigaleata]
MPRAKQAQDAASSSSKNNKASRTAAARSATAQAKHASDDATIAAVPWPAISRKALVAEVLLEDQLMVFAHFLLPTECRALLSMAGQLPMAATPPPKRDEAYRDNWRFSIDDPAFADRLWRAGLDAACARLEGGQHRCAVGLNSNIRLYRYDPQQRFGQHYDDSVRDKHGHQSEWTLLVYLNGDGDGDTVFYGPGKRQVTAVAPVAGMALLHRHGARCLRHEALEVKEGCKWVLRSDVMFAAR